MLARTLTVMHFKKDDTLLYQGEPATFFGVVLEGGVAPVINLEILKEKARGVGELVGELSLFNGGTRQASLIGIEDGFLAVFQACMRAETHMRAYTHTYTYTCRPADGFPVPFQFSELELLRSSTNEAKKTIGRKLNNHLARAALTKMLEGEGISLSSLSELEVQERLVELRIQQAEQGWVSARGSSPSPFTRHPSPSPSPSSLPSPFTLTIHPHCRPHPHPHLDPQLYPHLHPHPSPSPSPSPSS